jgi:hypothetical protein
MAEISARSQRPPQVLAVRTPAAWTLRFAPEQDGMHLQEKRAPLEARRSEWEASSAGKP